MEEHQCIHIHIHCISVHVQELFRDFFFLLSDHIKVSLNVRFLNDR